MRSEPSDHAPPNPETARLIIDAAASAVERQATTGDVIDGKAFSILTAATASVGALAISDVSDSAAATALLIVAAGLWISITATVLWTTRPRAWRVGRAADKLWDWVTLPPDEALHSYGANLAEGYRENRNVLEDKSKWLKRATALLSIELLVVLAALVVSQVSA